MEARRVQEPGNGHHLGSIVAQPSGIGNLTLNVENTAIAPLSRIIVVNSSLPSSTSFELDYNGAVVSPSNLVPICASSTVSPQVANVTAGSPYSFLIFLTYENSEEAVQPLNVTAKLG